MGPDLVLAVDHGEVDRRPPAATELDQRWQRTTFDHLVNNAGQGGGAPVHELDPGAGDWSTLSDRNAKDDIEPLDTAAVLDALARMPVYRWRWKTEAEGNRHIGPMAQDFHAAYGLNGDDDRHLLSVDTNGVALAAIQGLNAKLERENAALRAQLAALDAQQQRLEERLQLLDVALRTVQASGRVDTPRLAGVQ